MIWTDLGLLGDGFAGSAAVVWQPRTGTFASAGWAYGRLPSGRVGSYVAAQAAPGMITTAATLAVSNASAALSHARPVIRVIVGGRWAIFKRSSVQRETSAGGKRPGRAVSQRPADY